MRRNEPTQRSIPCPTPSSSCTAPGMAAGAGGGSSDLLERQGHKVFTPTLTGLGERSHLMRAGINVSTHVTDVVNVLKWEGSPDVVLCGHSYGGLVVSGVAEQSAAAIGSIVFLDAFVPENGDSMADLTSQAVRDNLKIAARARRPRRAGALGGGVPGQREGPGLGRRDVRAAADRHHDGEDDAHRRARDGSARRPTSARRPIPTRASTRPMRGSRRTSRGAPMRCRAGMT